MMKQASYLDQHMLTCILSGPVHLPLPLGVLNLVATVIVVVLALLAVAGHPLLGEAPASTLLVRMNDVTAIVITIVMIVVTVTAPAALLLGRIHLFCLFSA